MGDILVGWVDDSGDAHISDRWAAHAGLPEGDECQSWTLVPGESSQSCTNDLCTTHITASRSLKTGDSQDRVIEDNNYGTRIIVAYGFTDWTDSPGQGYHGTNRNTALVDFFRERADPLRALKNDPSIIQSEHRAGNYIVPEDSTVYHEICYSEPTSWNLSHIVGFEPIIEPSYMEPHVHHFVVMAYFGSSDCSGDFDTLYFTWAKGMGPFLLPSEVGFRAGGHAGSSLQSFVIQIHYDNPGGVNTLVDNSGLRIFRTLTLRQHAAGVMAMGDPFVRMGGTPVPAGDSKFEFECNSAFTAELANNSARSVTAFGRAMHMHNFGSMFASQQYASDGSLKRSTKIEYYDGDFQGISDFASTWQIDAGDSFKVECSYRTRDGAYFGPATSQEMCIDFVFYYPAIPTSIRSDFCTGQWGGFVVSSTPNSSSSSDVDAFYNRTFGGFPQSCPATPTPTEAPTLSSMTSPMAVLSTLSLSLSVMLSVCTA